MRPATYFFSRLHLAAGNQNKADLLDRAFTQSTPLLLGDYHWGIMDVTEIEYEHRVFKTGHLTKFTLQNKEEVVNLDKRTIELRTTDYRVKAKSRFYLHVDSSLLAFRRVGSDISPTRFATVFPKILVSVHDGFFVDASVMEVTEVGDVLQRLRDFTRIQKIDFTLHPSNPEFGDQWRELDDWLKIREIEQYKETLVNNSERGLQIAEDKGVIGKFHMASDGYGLGRVRGTLNDEDCVMSTSEDQVTMQTDKADDQPASILEDLIGRFRQIWSRTSGNDRQDT